MAKINLLDWRGELRTRKRNEFYKMLGFTALTGLMLVCGAFMIGKSRISGQDDRIDYLESEIKLVDQRLEEIKDLEKRRQALLDRMEVIDELQASRPNIVHLFDEIVKVTESNARVSNLMRDINSSAWTDNSRLTVIQAENKNGNNIYSFSVEADLTTPGADKEGAE